MSAKRLGAALAFALALGLLLLPQPDLDDRLERLRTTQDAELAAGAVQVDPAELLDLMHNNQIRLVLLDVRDEADYHLFHLLDARRVTLEELREGLGPLPQASIVMAMSNDESRAIEAWRILRAHGVPNAYVLAGGINGWLDRYGARGNPRPVALPEGDDDRLRYRFLRVLGDRNPIAWPDPGLLPPVEYTPKVKAPTSITLAGGGCG